ncbi:endonuclease III [Candidatus Woesearchaeota archaeon]|jgi:endonuclease-3|nr:endonuclease III [Candidatus Woesearchaeota archaeon]MBT4110939.1 endonuclease III [Candidatus Woesearchaeota archaeon]MBT4336549.1 endonuclease III [Candidatus Woesearchaeota archaeon]MBT4469702.1 endonuclease III [Candidatus Woesearchaeota archaeon]MBT6744064.1 endonuclease III [Candidatus Woesearchaeota archaeon]
MNLNYKQIFSILEKDHQETMLEQFKHYSKFQMLIATMLSARTKDTTTIPIVVRMFRKWRTPEDFLKVNFLELEKELYGIGFYRVKSRNIQKLSKMIISDFNGKVPDTLEGMVKLPGVGRKTANCMLNYAFGKSAVAVDIHVHRISNRLGWVKTGSESETELKLMKILPKELWNKVNMLLVNHGQNVCFPIKPNCKECKIVKLCKFEKKNL